MRLDCVWLVLFVWPSKRPWAVSLAPKRAQSKRWTTHPRVLLHDAALAHILAVLKADCRSCARGGQGRRPARVDLVVVRAAQGVSSRRANAHKLVTTRCLQSPIVLAGALACLERRHCGGRARGAAPSRHGWRGGLTAHTCIARDHFCTSMLGCFLQVRKAKKRFRASLAPLGESGRVPSPLPWAPPASAPPGPAARPPHVRGAQVAHTHPLAHRRSMPEETPTAARRPVRVWVGGCPPASVCGPAHTSPDSPPPLGPHKATRSKQTAALT